MTESLGRAELELATDQSGFDRGLDQARGRTTSFLHDVQAGFKKASGSIFQGIGVGVGIAAFGLVQRALGGVVDMAMGAVKAASDLDESLAKSRVVFGQHAAAVEKWADTAADAFGQSKQQALEAAGTYGNLFQAFGVGRDEATKMSMALVELAADLASFNNTSVDDAIIALRAGLSGETEPLKRYGIAINDARLRTELLSQGVRNLGGTLTPLQKSTAAYALILKDSTLAQGDFERTSGGLANTQRSLDAAMADLSAQIGKNLVPVMLSLARVAKDVVVPALGDATDAVVDFAENSKREFDAVHDFAADFSKAWDDLFHPVALDDLFPPEVAVDVTSTAEYMKDAVKDDLADISTSIRGVGTSAGVTADAVAESMDRIVASVTDLDDRLAKDAEDLADRIFDPAIEKAELAALTTERANLRREIASGKLNTAELRDASARLANMDREIFAREAKLTRHQGVTGDIAFLTSKAYKDGLGSQDAATRAAAAKLGAGIVRQWNDLSADAFPYGFRTGDTYVDGIIEALENRLVDTRRAVGRYRNLLRASSPPGPESPLHGIDVWGRRTGSAWVDNVIAAIDGARAAVRGSVAGIGRELAPLTNRHSLMGMAGAGLPALGGLGLSPGALTVGGTVRVEHVLSPEAASALRRAGYDERGVARELADATGLVTNLQQLTAMTG